MIEIGCFVSSHGFGHATRISAILEALARRADVLPHIFTTVERDIFAQTLHSYRYHRQLTDIGFVQNDAFAIDVVKTCSQLSSLLPYEGKLIENLAHTCRNCRYILCDISPMGIAVGAEAKIPSVLVENFTWDWLYAPFRKEYPEIGFFSDYLKKTIDSAGHRIQTEPVCQRRPADLRCGPIFRSLRDGARLRRKLGCGSRRLVLVTLGGISFTPAFLEDLHHHDDFFFLFGGQQQELQIGENVRLLNRFSSHYHPDLIACADLAVFKSGYSTLAECYQCTTPALCIRRRDFAESEVLERFAVEEMGATLLEQDDFVSGRWLELLSSISFEQRPARVNNGADAVADFLVERLH